MRNGLWRSNATQHTGAISLLSIDGIPCPTWGGIQILRWRSSFDQQMGTIISEIPLTILSTTQEEGVNYPFFTRGPELMAPVRRKRRNAIWGIVSEIPIPIFETVNPNDLLFFNNPTEMPIGRYKERKRKAGMVVRESFQRPFILPPIPATEYQRTLCSILAEIQRHLLEPVVDDGATWQLWTRAEVEKAFNRRVLTFLRATGVTRQRTTINVSLNVADYTLPSSVLTLRRMVWDPSGGANEGSRSLLPIDEAQLDAVPGWEVETGEPVAYVLRDDKFRLYPIPSVTGVIQISYVPFPATVTGCQNIPVPSVFAPFLKWGVIADLLRKEGEANDPERAKYAEGRYSEGEELGRLLLGTDI